MLRIAQNGKSTYKSLKISVAAKHWDFERTENKYHS
ncbi:Arm DNA-binding domain-containing protein [Phocaeicola coprocola]|nr:Arm DNA-binding domain-containing protein [Phocaeicola coprocola]